jgi:hypothetical protein
MSAAPEPLDGPELSCPVCKARQAWSDTCRRCRADLSLLHRVERSRRASRRRALGLLREGRAGEALPFARQAHALSPDAASRRLLTVCLLLVEAWAEALQTADG